MLALEKKDEIYRFSWVYSWRFSKWYGTTPCKRMSRGYITWQCNFTSWDKRSEESKYFRENFRYTKWKVKFLFKDWLSEMTVSIKDEKEMFGWNVKFHWQPEHKLDIVKLKWTSSKLIWNLQKNMKIFLEKQ